MTTNFKAIALIALWVLSWGVGGSLIDAGLINRSVYTLEGGQWGTATTFTLWSVAWGAFGWWLYNRLTRPTPLQ